MKSPITGKEMILKREPRHLTFRKEEFEVVYHYYLDADSNEQFTTDELDELNLIQLHNKYRERYNIPFPDEIAAIRSKYELPASKMAEVLGFGINVYRNYESGEVPNESNGKLIRLAQDTKQFQHLVELSTTIDADAKRKILDKLQAIRAEEKKSLLERVLTEYLLGSQTPDEFTGYRRPNLQKLTDMIVFFAEQCQPWKTKLNKLLYFSDFTHYKKTGYSISGTRYVAINLGPVPDNFNAIFEFVARQDFVNVFSQEMINGGIGEQFKPNPLRKFEPDIFAPDELNTLTSIAQQFGTMSSQAIIDRSHEELGWRENIARKQTISYKYSFESQVL